MCSTGRALRPPYLADQIIGTKIAARAPSAFPICSPSFALAFRTKDTALFEGGPQENCTIGAPASNAHGSDSGGHASK